MTDNPLIEAMAMAIARADGYDMDAHLWRPEAVAALAAIGPGSEAWAEMVEKAARAIMDDGLFPGAFDNPNWLDGKAEKAQARRQADAALRAALGFGE